MRFASITVKRIGLRIIKWISFIVFGIICLFVIIWTALQIPKVQTFVVGKLTKTLSAKLQVPVKISKVNISFFKTIVLEGIYVEDKKKDTLLFADELNINIGLLSLTQKKIEISSIGLVNAYVNIYQKEQDSTSNYAFILKAFASDTTIKDTTSSPWKFDMEGVQLEKVKFKYYDYPSHTDVSIAVQDLNVDINTLGLDSKNTKINDINIDGLNVTYNQIKGEALKDTIQKKIQDDPPAKWLVGVSDLNMKNSHLIFNNENIIPNEEAIDYNHLNLSSLNLKVSDFILAGGDISANVKKFTFQEHKGFKLDNLAINAVLKDSKIHAELNQFKTPFSDLSDKLTVDIQDITKIEQAIGEIQANANFDATVISMKDVIIFSPALEKYKDLNLKISGDLSGKVADLHFEDADLALNDENYLQGNFDIKGLPDINKLVFDVDIQKLEAEGNYISGFLPKNNPSFNPKGLGKIEVELSAKGNIHKFISKSKIHSAAGMAGYDLNVALDQSFIPTKVDGNIFTKNLNVGRIINNPQIGLLTLQADLKSQGISSTYLSSKVTSFEFNKYNYKNIAIDGNYINKVANVTIGINDSNLVAGFKASFDQSSKIALSMIDGNIDANLYKLNLFSSPLQLSTNLNAHAAGLAVDSIKAGLLITKFILETDSIKYTLDSLQASMSHDMGNKEIHVKSALINADVNGHFNYEELPDAIQHLISHYMTSLKPKSKPVHLDNIAFDIELGNTKGITQIFMGGLSTVKDIHLAGSFTASDHILKIDGKVGTVYFGDQKVKNVLLIAKGDKEKLSFDIHSNTLYLNKSVKFYNPSLKGNFSKDVLTFNLGMRDTTSASKSKLDMDGIFTMLNDSINLKIPKMDLNLRGSQWKMPARAEISYATKYLRIVDFNLTSGKQSITIGTKNEKSKNASLYAGFDQVSIGELSKIFGLTYELDGKINGKASVINPMGNMSIDSDLRMDSLSADKISIGDLKIVASKTTTGPVNLNTTLSGATNNISVAGLYYLDRQEDNMNFKVNVENLNLHSIQPFVKDIFYNLEGNIKANMLLNGSTSFPNLTGNLRFKENNLLGISAIQTPYKINNQEIIFNTNSIQLNNFTVRDTANQPATISGTINHDHLTNYVTDLKLSASDFNFLNSQNTLAPVYGKFVADLTAKVNGPVDNLAVWFKVTTRPNTNLFLNVATQKTLSGTPAYISFVNFRRDSSGFNKYILDSIAVSKAPKIDMSRFKINGNITVTKDAGFNIVINPQTGDQIFAKGDGSFKINFDSNNDINFFGQYVIDQGTYNLSLMSLVKRNFKIDRGSTINFYGNPQAGEMNIAAIYTTKASRYDLVSDMALTKEEISAAKRRLPVDLYLKLKGEFLKPEISFDIKVPESGNSVGKVEERMNQIRADETEINKQVFGLLVMGKFFPYQGGSSHDSGGGGMNETATETVGNLLADQLNKISAEYLNGVEIEVNTEAQSLDNQVSSNVSVMASKQVSDRLKVGVGGKSNVNNQGGSSGVTGEYNVLYQVNKQGTLNLKLFSTSQQNIYNASNVQLSGFSLNHNKNFDALKDFFRK